MSAYKTDQEIVVYRDRRFHFVSYEGHAADLARHREELPPTWFLMQANKRWPVMRQVPGQDRAEMIKLLTDWLERIIFTGNDSAEEPATKSTQPKDAAIRKRGRRAS